MKNPTLWVCALAAVVGLNIVASLFMSPAIRMFRMPLILATYVIGIVLFFKLGVWRGLALWCGIGIVSGLLYWSYEFWSAKHSKEPDAKAPSLVTLVHGLVAWPLMLPEVIEYSWAELFPTKKKRATSHSPATKRHRWRQRCAGRESLDDDCRGLTECRLTDRTACEFQSARPARLPFGFTLLVCARCVCWTATCCAN